MALTFHAPTEGRVRRCCVRNPADLMGGGDPRVPAAVAGGSGPGGWLVGRPSVLEPLRTFFAPLARHKTTPFTLLRPKYLR